MTVRLPESLHENIKRLAQDEGISINQFLVVAAAEKMSALMDCLIKYIEDNDLTQQEAADRMGVQRSRVGDVGRGHISVFSIDALVAMAARVGLHPLKVAA